MKQEEQCSLERPLDKIQTYVPQQIPLFAAFEAKSMACLFRNVGLPGGGPLGQAACKLAPRFGIPIIAPISAAVRQLSWQLGYGREVIRAEDTAAR